MLSFEADIPFVTELGFTLHKRAGGESELHYTPRPEHLNSFGVTHGGALMALLDVTLAQAASSVASTPPPIRPRAARRPLLFRSEDFMLAFSMPYPFLWSRRR